MTEYNGIVGREIWREGDKEMSWGKSRGIRTFLSDIILLFLDCFCAVFLVKESIYSGFVVGLEPPPAGCVLI